MESDAARIQGDGRDTGSGTHAEKWGLAMEPCECEWLINAVLC